MTINRRHMLLITGATALSPLLTVSRASAAGFVNVVTGGTSGVYYPLGVAISKLVGEKVEGARPSVQSTKGSVENLNLLQDGKAEVGFALGDAVKEGVAGNTEMGFKGPLDNVRTLAAIYNNFVQIVASKESGITSIADLKGKRVSVGAPKSGTELNARTILTAAGISYDDLGKVEYLDFAQSVELMKNRQLDATLQSAGLGVASIRDLAASIPITVVAVPADVVNSIGAPFVAGVIPAGTYTGQDADVPTAAVQNFLVTRADLDEETVFQITKAIFDNLPELHAAHAAAKGIDPAAAGKNPVAPMHPGAERYFAGR